MHEHSFTFRFGCILLDSKLRKSSFWSETFHELAIFLFRIVCDVWIYKARSVRDDTFRACVCIILYSDGVFVYVICREAVVKFPQRKEIFLLFFTTRDYIIPKAASGFVSLRYVSLIKFYHYELEKLSFFQYHSWILRKYLLF